MKMTEESQKPTLSLITICKTVQMESKQSTSFYNTIQYNTMFFILRG